MSDVSRRQLWAATKRRLSSAEMNRGLKYAVLLVALAVTLRIVFDGFSYYLARRSIDAELDSKKIASLEYLTIVRKREQALVLADLETRCAERHELAVLRSVDAQMDKDLLAAYQASFDVKNAIIDYLQHRVAESIAHKVDIPALIREVNQASFVLAKLESLVKPVAGASRGDEDYKKAARQVVDGIREASKGEEAKLAAYADKFSAIRDKFGLGGNPSVLANVDVLERRLARLKEEHAKNEEKLKGLDEVLSRYSAWTDALTGGAAFNTILDEMAFRLREDNKGHLDKAPCDSLNDYYTMVNGRLFAADDLLESDGAGLWHLPARIGRAYSEALVIYFQTPPIAQTLLVTLFLGALGALTINVLRLSKIGWWNDQDDPLWGEILLCPLIGALAAFGIFLLGSTGLLLTSDVNSAQGGTPSLSAFFIGLMGFISGFLYDEAFGRVRRVGSSMFGGDEVRSGPTADDRSLAEVLRTAGAPLAAEFVLRLRAGRRVAGKPEFTLLVPFDDTLRGWTVQAWRDNSGIAEPLKADVWFHHHCAAKRVMFTDASGTSTVANAIEVEDGAKFPIAKDGTDIKVNGVKVRRADIVWGKGVIHLLDGELAQAVAPAGHE